jgi:hypothetical protein
VSEAEDPTVTPETRAKLQEAETFLRSLGCRECRVHWHGDGLVRVEVPPAELPRLAEPGARAGLVRRLKELGFRFVTLDLEDFCPGSPTAMTPLPTVTAPDALVVEARGRLLHLAAFLGRISPGRGVVGEGSGPVCDRVAGVRARFLEVAAALDEVRRKHVAGGAEDPRLVKVRLFLEALDGHGDGSPTIQEVFDDLLGRCCP